MRNVFLSLLLANLLFVAWQIWVDPVSPSAQDIQPNRLILFSFGTDPRAPEVATIQGQPPVAGMAAVPAAAETACLGLGPLVDLSASRQAGKQLAARGVDAIPIARDTQTWLGHWAQIGGFSSIPEAETARQRLIAGGLAETYLMQDGAQPLLSLGVFQELARAERVASVARGLGFEVGIRDRYRPTVEQWLLIQPRPNQRLEPADLSLAGDRIMRVERLACAAANPPSGSPEDQLPPGPPAQPL